MIISKFLDKFKKYTFRGFVKFLLSKIIIKLGVAKLLKLNLFLDIDKNLFLDIDKKTFALYSEFIDRVYGRDNKIIFGKIPLELVNEIKKEFCNNNSFAESSSIILNSASTHPILQVTDHSQTFKLKTKENIIAGNMHKFTYSTNLCLKKLHDTLRKMFSVHIKSPFIFINTRLWKTKPGTKNLGMSEFHKDGFSNGFRKIMVYLTPSNEEFGNFEYICPEAGLIRNTVIEDGGGGVGGRVFFFLY